MTEAADAHAASALLQAAESAAANQDWLEAAVRLSAVLALEPANPVALYGLGNVQARAQAREAAICSLRRVVAVVPWFDVARADLGGLLIEAGRLAEAGRQLRCALALDPTNAGGLHNYAHSLQAEGVIPRQSAYRRTFAVRLGDRDDSAYLQRFHYDPSYTREEIFQAHVDWGKRHRVAAAPRASLLRDPDKRRPLHVAYLSADFSRHPVGTLLSAAIVHHDRDRVRVTLCDTGTTVIDDVTATLTGIADRWVDLRGVSDESAVRQLREAAIDICVDLSGHTPGNRLPVLARRVAPVQASWLGYWNTTGMPEMDYLLTCAEEVPPERDRFFTERVVRLPLGRFCYAIPPFAPPVAPLPSERVGHVTFGCFVNRGVHAEQLAAFAAILRALPTARLVLRSGGYAHADVRMHVLNGLASLGVADAGARVAFHGRIPLSDLLVAYGEIDIALDAFPFSGLMTNLEALTMGVPVVTAGLARIESRQTLAMLHRLGLPDLAAESVAGYVDIAVALASDPARLRHLRGGLRLLVADRLCRGEAFCQSLEEVYRALWSEACDRAADVPPP